MNIAQQFKFNPNTKAIISFILGVINIVMIIAIREFLLPIAMVFPQIGVFVLLFILPLFAVVGLVLGIMSLKSTKRNFAIAGIVLCLISLLPLIYFLIY